MVKINFLLTMQYIIERKGYKNLKNDHLRKNENFIKFFKLRFFIKMDHHTNILKMFGLKGLMMTSLVTWYKAVLMKLKTRTPMGQNNEELTSNLEPRSGYEISSNHFTDRSL